MSATVETSNNLPWKRRRMPQEQPTELQIAMKMPRYYYRLASESSIGSDEGTESIHSIQDHETDVLPNTSETDSRSDNDEYELVEYEVASLSENEILSCSTSGSDDRLFVAAAMEAMCDSSENWITDVEESDNSSLDSFIATLDFRTCVKCKSVNDNPLYRYCEKCFQDRKKTYPPRPRRHRKAKIKVDESPVKLVMLKTGLKDLLSQDSGAGSSQDCPSLDLDQIVVPNQHLTSGAPISDVRGALRRDRTPKGSESELKRKRRSSESSISDVDIKRSKRTRFQSGGAPPCDIDLSEINRSDRSLPFSQTSEDTGISLSQKSLECASESSEEFTAATDRSLTLPATIADNGRTVNNAAEKSPSDSQRCEEICVICNNAPQDSIFVHTNIGHQCCCYKCAKRTLHTTKRCPICNRPVHKIIKVFKS